LLSDRRYADAVKEFDTALARAPDSASAFYHRAIARGGLKRWTGGIDDLTRAMTLGPPSVRGLLLRAFMRRKTADIAGAKADEADAARLEPVDESDYIARGRHRSAKDPKAALADFERASEMNPRYVNAWQNQAHVLSEKLGQPEKAMAVLDKALELAPEFAPARVGRAVLLARAGKRTEAHADAEKALAVSRDAEVRYQVACVYALTSKAQPTDKALAVQHFRVALQLGYAEFDVIDSDTDLATLRDENAFTWELFRAKQLRAK